MGSFKSLALLALLLSLSLAVLADTSNDATYAKGEVKPSEGTDAVEPQQGGSRPQAAEVEANKDEVENKDAVVEPQQWGFCRFGCCGGMIFGRCNFCCRRPQATEAVEAEAVEVNAVEPQQRGRGRGCRYGCCGPWRYGRCSYCCRSPQVEAEEGKEVVEPQQRWGGGCRYGCCGPWRYGRCGYCCRSPQAEAVEGVEPQQRWGGGCRYGCCGPWRYGRCGYCCRSPQAETQVVEEKKKREEAKP